jgi:hypothetical protein
MKATSKILLSASTALYMLSVPVLAMDGEDKGKTVSHAAPPPVGVAAAATATATAVPSGDPECKLGVRPGATVGPSASASGALPAHMRDRRFAPRPPEEMKVGEPSTKGASVVTPAASPRQKFEKDLIDHLRSLGFADAGALVIPYIFHTPGSFNAFLSSLLGDTECLDLSGCGLERPHVEAWHGNPLPRLKTIRLDGNFLTHPDINCLGLMGLFGGLGGTLKFVSLAGNPLGDELRYRLFPGASDLSEMRLDLSHTGMTGKGLIRFLGEFNEPIRGRERQEKTPCWEHLFWHGNSYTPKELEGILKALGNFDRLHVPFNVPLKRCGLSLDKRGFKMKREGELIVRLLPNYLSDLIIFGLPNDKCVQLETAIQEERKRWSFHISSHVSNVSPEEWENCETGATDIDGNAGGTRAAPAPAPAVSANANAAAPEAVAVVRKNLAKKS